MTTSFKKALLLGTALVAVGAATAPANATNQTLTGATQWGSVGTPSTSTTDGTTAAAGDNVNLSTFTLTVQNDGTNSDGSANIHTFLLGDVTGTTGSLVISTSTTSAYTVSDLTTTVGSVAISGAGNVSILSEDNDDSTVTASITRGLSTGGALVITAVETSTADDVTLTVGGNTTITGTTGINAGAFAGSTGNLVLNGNTNTFTGAVTLTGGAGAGSNATLTLNGTNNTFTGGISLATATKSQLIINGGKVQTVTGALSSNGALSTATSGTDATIATASTVGTTSVAANTTLRFSNDTTSTTSITNAGTVYVAQGKVLTSGSFLGTGGIYNLAVSDANGTLAAADFGRLASGAAIDLANEKIVFNVTGRLGAATTGTLVGTVFNGGGTAVDTAAAADVTDNSALYDFDLVLNTNEHDVLVTKTTSDVGTITTNGNNDTLVRLLDTDSVVSALTTGNLKSVLDSVLSSSSASVMDERAEATLPSVDAGAIDTVVDVAAQSVGVTDLRLASLRSGDETGAVAGQLSNGMEVWVQGFGKLATQDDRGDVDGYEADTYGAVVGIDTADVMDGATLGLAVSYGMTDVESDNANTTETDIDSYQVSLYGEQDLGDAAFVNATLAYGRNSIDQTRHNVGGVSGLNADADYDSSQYVATVGIGRTLALASGMTITPTTGMNFQHVSIDDYTETGAGTANMAVETDSVNILELGVGAEVAFDAIDMDGGMLTPAVDFGYRYDVIGDAVEASSTFTGGGAAFKTTGADPQQGKFNIGASLAYDVDSAMNVKVSYDYEMKGEDYSAHAGFVRAGYKF